MPEPAAPQRDAALDAQLAQTQADALAARQAADEQARAERESIAKQLAESEAREAERETKEKAAAAEDTRQRALRARGRASLIAQGSTEEGVKTTFGG